MFLTQRRKVSQSVCVVLRSLRAIFYTDMEYAASFHVLHVSTGVLGSNDEAVGIKKLDHVE